MTGTLAGRQFILKRAVDLTAATVGLLLTSPLMALASLSVLVGSGTPILFRQTRLGLNGSPFTLYKFRTMVNGAETKGHGIRVAHDDSRITSVGHLLRRLSLDELPQLFNILRGDMSMVGPRPVLPNHPKPLDQYSEPERSRFLVRPGITGLAQVHGRGNMTWPEKFLYDAEYVQTYSIWLDLSIVLRTIKVALNGRDIYLDEGHQRSVGIGGK